MNKQILESWCTNLEHDLASIENSGFTLCKTLSDSLQIVKTVLNKVAKHLEEAPFENQHEEICFYKEISPRIYSCWIFAIAIYQLELNRPCGTDETCRCYFEEELKIIQRYFNRNAFYYHYYKSGASELDTICFVKDAQMESIPVTEVLLSESDLNTSFDLLFAKFIAFEKLQNRILLLMHGEVVRHEASQDLTAVKTSTTKINLSVDQIGLLARAADDARLIAGRSFRKICDELAPCIATPEKDSISPNSLRSNAYLSEISDKQIAIKALEKMIDFIKGY
ncbi:RteC domain-containing protein [Pelobium manganitolerans]|uniref:RteC domain-containing protein n=1 Tax=Pelobium manganitolerans TaxID=1842495 RepID=UPI003FA37C64